MFPKEVELVDAVEEIKKNILIINGLIMKVRIKNPIWGVPITFLYKYCPTQFEIVGITENAEYLKPLYLDGCEKYDRPYVNGKRMYSRLLIRKKK